MNIDQPIPIYEGTVRITEASLQKSFNKLTKPSNPRLNLTKLYQKANRKTNEPSSPPCSNVNRRPDFQHKTKKSRIIGQQP
ncbi:MAG: hypothetical protein PWQ32_1549 [Thermococcaceae archaeon]|nr:hypothetical protein [Thermococcaceae archaeon]